MDKIHKRFTVEQVKVLLQSYFQGTIARVEVEEVLQINKTRFFSLLKEYRRDPAAFSIAYERATHVRLSAVMEATIAAIFLTTCGAQATSTQVPDQATLEISNAETKAG